MRIIRITKGEDKGKIQVEVAGFDYYVSLPFKPGRQIAVKIIDARGVESLKIEKM